MRGLYPASSVVNLGIFPGNDYVWIKGASLFTNTITLIQHLYTKIVPIKLIATVILEFIKYIQDRSYIKLSQEQTVSPDVKFNGRSPL